MDVTGEGRSNTGVADLTSRMAIGTNTTIAITATRALRTTHCSPATETMAELENRWLMRVCKVVGWSCRQDLFGLHSDRPETFVPMSECVFQSAIELMNLNA